MPRRPIEAVMDDHVQALMSLDGVVGVAIGRTADGTPCLMVLVEELTGARRAALPDRLEGHPVCPFESGRIRALERDGEQGEAADGREAGREAPED